METLKSKTNPMGISGNYVSSLRRPGMKDFEIGRPVGRGSFGQVYLARTRLEKYPMVLKCLSIKQLVEWGMLTQLRREIDIHATLNHPQIIKLYAWFDDVDKIVLALEWAFVGDMFHSLRKEGKFSEVKSSVYLRQVVSALDYCHGLNVTHRDIKPENVMIFSDWECKIGDFGWSKLNTQKLNSTMCGTMEYMALELVENTGLYDKTVDNWACGILLYEMLHGESPFVPAGTDEERRNFQQLIYKLSTNITYDAVKVIRGLLVHKPGERMDLKAILEEPFITKHI
uniref:Aurora kinase n=1 Tax=Rhabditophanes sp. KR3021 TaxID=114890 RepID=A0AC35TU74_9BILA